MQKGSSEFWAGAGASMQKGSSEFGLAHMVGIFAFGGGPGPNMFGRLIGCECITAMHFFGACSVPSIVGSGGTPNILFFSGGLITPESFAGLGRTFCGGDGGSGRTSDLHVFGGGLNP